MTELFLSHSSVDEDLAGAVARVLQEAGVTPLQLSTGIRSAQDWSERIRGDLMTCDAALFVVTPHYIERPAWLYMEWAAAWVQDKPPHVLLIDVDKTELPEVMRETQLTIFDGNTDVLARNLLSVITGLEPGDAKLITLAGRLVDLIKSESAKWEEAKWARIAAAIAAGVATLPDRDLDWIVANDRVRDLVARVRDDFAHPALVHKVSRHLIAHGHAGEAAAIASVLPGYIQVALFRDLLEMDIDIARALAGAGAGRETRRACAVAAAERGLPDLAEQIADMAEHAYDRRVIAEQLLWKGSHEHALRVIEKADKAYEKRTFAISCLAEGRVDMALEVASTISLSYELRRIGERLVDDGHAAELEAVAQEIDKSSEKRSLALYALKKGRIDAVETVARSIRLSKDLLELAKAVYDSPRPDGADQVPAELALRLLLLMSRNEERREFMEHVMQEDPNAAVQFAADALETSSERRRLAEILSDAGLGQEAVDVVGLLARDDERERLFWFALAKREGALADAVVASISDPSLRARCEAIQTAAVAEYEA